MSFKRFLSAIDSSWIGNVVARRLELIKQTDPDHIYVENIRSFFGLSARAARFFCELAVREGVFEKRLGIQCPEDRNVIEFIGPEEELPDSVTCKVCEIEEKLCVFDPSQLDKIEVYALAKGFKGREAWGN